jgi:hypothetical protein
MWRVISDLDKKMAIALLAALVLFFLALGNVFTPLSRTVRPGDILTVRREAGGARGGGVPILVVKRGALVPSEMSWTYHLEVAGLGGDRVTFAITRYQAGVIQDRESGEYTILKDRPQLNLSLITIKLQRIWPGRARVTVKLV